MIGTIILAAGKSQRMGRPKLLLPWGKTSIIGHIIDQWRELGASQIAVVCSNDDQLLKQELDRLGFPETQRIFNSDPERGMFSSIQCAAQWGGWNNDVVYWVIALGDQPHLSGQTLKNLIQLALAHPLRISVPRQAGHRRHPVFLPRKIFHRLAHSHATDLKHFLDQADAELGFCEVDDPALEMDIDDPNDYQKALRLYVQES